MTSSQCLGRLRQVACLGLMGVLAAAGCQEDRDQKNDGGTATPGDASIDQKPLINASPGTVNLGAVDVGMASSPQTVTITNVGTVPAILTITPLPAGIIAVTGCATALAAGASCILFIAVTPSVPGPIAGTVAVAAAGGNTVTIGVSALVAGGGGPSVTPTAVYLDDVTVGVAVRVAVTVTAGATLTGLSVGVRSADLTLDPTTDCPATLAAGASCNVVATFTSTRPGASTGNAIVVSYGGITNTVPVLASVLTLASLAAEPSALSLTATPGATGAAGTIAVGNGGGTATGPVAVAIEPGGAPFEILINTCSSGAVLAGGECALTVAYHPAATASTAETATLVVTDMGPGASVAIVALTGAPIVDMQCDDSARSLLELVETSLGKSCGRATSSWWEGSIGVDADGRVYYISSSGAPANPVAPADPQAWIDSVATYRWRCLAGQTVYYGCSV